MLLDVLIIVSVLFVAIMHIAVGRRLRGVVSGWICWVLYFAGGVGVFSIFSQFVFDFFWEPSGLVSFGSLKVWRIYSSLLSTISSGLMVLVAVSWLFLGQYGQTMQARLRAYQDTED